MRMQGSTAHFDVSYEETLGGDGAAAADAVLAACEDDYQSMVEAFGGVEPPGLPFAVQIEGGHHPYLAAHEGCQGTTLRVVARQPLDTAVSQMATLAEVAECFMAAIGTGWNCGHGNGEALSLALALDRHPIADGWFIRTWQIAGRPDYVSVNVPTDQNEVSNSCGAIFLFFLHSYLGYDWAEITAAGGATLAETYAKLSGGTDAYGRFLHATDEFPASDTDNPFDLLPVYTQLINLQML
jgi:hypothetical protein